MPQYRKKPVVIETFQMTLERCMDNAEWPEWLNAAWNDLEVVTLEGNRLTSWGELYPCKPDIFAATYDPVEPPFSTTYDAVLSQKEQSDVEHIEQLNASRPKPKMIPFQLPDGSNVDDFEI